MNTKLVIASALAVTLTHLMSGVALAATMTQEQELNQQVKVTCKAGAYGQDSNCTAEASQSGKQNQRTEVVYRPDGTAIKVHETADAALDTPALVALIGTMATGALAFVIKSRVA